MQKAVVMIACRGAVGQAGAAQSARGTVTVSQEGVSGARSAIPSLGEGRVRFILIAQPAGYNLALMPFGRQRRARSFQQWRQCLRESVGRIDDEQARAIIDAGLLAIV